MNVATDRPNPLSALIASADRIIPASASHERDAVLKAYSIVAGMSMEKVIEEGTLLSGDLIFQQPIRESARELVKAGKKVYYFHWDYPNPWPAPFLGGVAHHGVDRMFIFQTLKDIYPNDLARHIGEKAARYWVTFGAKGVPHGWKEFNYGVVAVVDPKEGWVQRTVEEDRKIPWRREDRWDLIEKIQPFGQTWGDQMANRRDGFWG
jgi:hypothetical protein